MRGPDHENLSAFRETLREAGISSTIIGVWNPHGPKGDPYGLTGKQRKAVELAFTEGYFKVPRETNLTNLAETVDITRQSYSRRLNRGLHRVLATTVMATP
ncbi:helix-turn-helix domain-containing protein [Halomicroarcula sp. GCM10025709]|uniref:helix-turn-helix domain-containing protein n=1 Tax=Halomicroarcula sp. GCM10025709 TaxID=3252669 RepID=UPI0036225162